MCLPRWLGLATAALALAACGGPGAATPASSTGAAATNPAASGSGTDSGAAATTYPPLVADASWVRRDGERALVVTPTAYLRAHGSIPVATEAWRRVVAAVPEADTPGMRDQFVCHAQFASGKDGWYLEPSRPAVGYLATVAAQCNPGTPRDVG